MSLKKLFSKLFIRSKAPSSSDAQFPKDGILWHEWNDATRKLIADRNRPVLLFVANQDGMVWPFLRGVFQEMPLNAKLRELLNGYFIGLLMKGGEVPEYFRDLGAGGRFNIAILSPAGLTPMATIDPSKGKPKEIVGTILKVLENLQKTY